LAEEKPMESETSDRLTALAALYQGEKTDASYVFNTAMAMMGLAVAYLIGAIPFVQSLSRGPSGWLFVSLLPVPLWLVVAFHSLMTLNAMSHGVSVKIIEDALFDAGGLGKSTENPLGVSRNLVGSAAGDRIMDVTQSSAAHRICSYLVYGGVVLLVLGFTFYAVYAANLVLKIGYLTWSRYLMLAIAAGVYLALLTVVGWSWKVGLALIDSNRRDIEDLAARKSRN
jgi:hypothetical protein